MNKAVEAAANAIKSLEQHGAATYGQMATVALAAASPLISRECAEALSLHADVWAMWPHEDRVRAWTAAIAEKFTAQPLSSEMRPENPSNVGKI